MDGLDILSFISFLFYIRSERALLVSLLHGSRDDGVKDAQGTGFAFLPRIDRANVPE